MHCKVMVIVHLCLFYLVKSFPFYLVFRVLNNARIVAPLAVHIYIQPNNMSRRLKASLGLFCRINGEDVSRKNKILHFARNFDFMGGKEKKMYIHS